MPLMSMQTWSVQGKKKKHPELIHVFRRQIKSSFKQPQDGLSH